MLHINLNKYQKSFYICLAVIVVAYAFLRMPIDDGLRHIGLAFSNVTSWGDIYPFSRFEEFKDYDPWYGYDKILHLAAAFMRLLFIPDLVSKFILIKILAIIFPASLLYLAFKRSGIISRICDKKTFTLALLLMLFFLGFAFQRSAIGRPFIFGTLFLLYSINQVGFVKGFISSALLAFFYPYLSWFYILPVSFSHFVAGNRKYSLGAVLFLIIFLILQSDSFWGFQIALFQSDIIRTILKFRIGEFGLTLTTGFFISIIVLFGIMYPGFSEKARRFNYIKLLLIIYMIPSLKYVRYFVDILAPLLFIDFGIDIFELARSPFSRLIKSWKILLQKDWNKFRLFQKIPCLTKLSKDGTTVKKGEAKGKKISDMPLERISVRSLIVICYLIIAITIFQVNRDYYDEFNEFSKILEPIPSEAVVLLPFNQQYKTIFFRPDLQLIPSCEIGFPSKEILNEYDQFMNKGNVLSIARKTGARYFLESGDMYINPKQGNRLELIKEEGKLKLWEIRLK